MKLTSLTGLSDPQLLQPHRNQNHRRIPAGRRAEGEQINLPEGSWGGRGSAFQGIIEEENPP